MGVKDDQRLSSHRIWVPDILWQELAVEAVREKTNTSTLLAEMLADRYPHIDALTIPMPPAEPRARPSAAVAARAAREMASGKG